MTRYVVAVPAEVYQGVAGISTSLLLHLPTGTFAVPLQAFVAEDDLPAQEFKIADMVDMNMHRICALIDSQMRRIKQLELDLAAARRAGYVPPAPPPAPPPADKPVREYKPLDHGPREGA